MTQNVPLDGGDVAIEPFFDATQEFIGAAAPSFYLIALNDTTIRAVAGSGDSQNAVAIEGRYRYLAANLDAIHPGGATNTYKVWVTGSANSFTAVPTTDNTVYAFGLTISNSTPGTAIKRQIGEVDWDGSKITALRHWGGTRRDDAPLFALAPHANFVPLRVKGAASQAVNLTEWQNNAGTVLASMSLAGLLTTTGGITDSSTGGITASGNGGKTTLELTNTGTNTGITIGADTNLYRSAANTLMTDDALDVVGQLDTRADLFIVGQIQFRPSAGAASDTNLYRSAADTLKTDDALIVTGALTVTSSTATVGGQAVLVANSAAGGDMTGTLANLQYAAGSIVNADVSASAALALSKLATTGALQASSLVLSGALTVGGQVGFNGASPAARPDYTVTNGTTDRTFDANNTTINELADVVATIISDLTAIGLTQ